MSLKSRDNLTENDISSVMESRTGGYMSQDTRCQTIFRCSQSQNQEFLNPLPKLSSAQSTADTCFCSHMLFSYSHSSNKVAVPLKIHSRAY